MSRETFHGMKVRSIEGVGKLSSKGQVVVPVDIRTALGMKEGDQLRFTLEDGKIVAEPVRLLSKEELFGIFDEPEDEGHFVLNREVAKSDRAEDVLFEYRDKETPAKGE